MGEWEVCVSGAVTVVLAGFAAADDGLGVVEDTLYFIAAQLWKGPLSVSKS